MIILLSSQWVTFYTLIISTMTNYDVDLELKEQQISLYEDELSEFIEKFYNDKDFREKLKKENDVYITFEEWDECYALYVWDDIITMNTKLDKCLEKAFNCIRTKQLEESFLPF